MQPAARARRRAPSGMKLSPPPCPWPSLSKVRLAHVPSRARQPDRGRAAGDHPVLRPQGEGEQSARGERARARLRRRCGGRPGGALGLALGDGTLRPRRLFLQLRPRSPGEPAAGLRPVRLARARVPRRRAPPRVDGLDRVRRGSGGMEVREERRAGLRRRGGLLVWDARARPIAATTARSPRTKHARVALMNAIAAQDRDRRARARAAARLARAGDPGGGRSAARARARARRPPLLGGRAGLVRLPRRRPRPGARSTAAARTRA